MKLTLHLPAEFVDFCARYNVTPERVLKSFVSDLARIQNWVHPDAAAGRPPRPHDGYQSNGSDEREMAFDWFERVGYVHLADQHIKGEP